MEQAKDDQFYEVSGPATLEWEVGRRYEVRVMMARTGRLIS